MCGSTDSGTDPYTDAQFESVAHLVAAASKALGIPVNRSTVVVHADINSVSRRTDPWPPATREARVKRVIVRANAILRPPIVTVTVKAGDTLSEIAAAHGPTLATVLRPEPRAQDRRSRPRPRGVSALLQRGARPHRPADPRADPLQALIGARKMRPR